MDLTLTFAPASEITLEIKEGGKTVMAGNVLIKMGTCSPEITKLIMANSWKVMEFEEVKKK